MRIHRLLGVSSFSLLRDKKTSAISSSAISTIRKKKLTDITKNAYWTGNAHIRVFSPISRTKIRKRVLVGKSA